MTSSVKSMRNLLVLLIFIISFPSITLADIRTEPTPSSEPPTSTPNVGVTPVIASTPRITPIATSTSTPVGGGGGGGQGTPTPTEATALTPEAEPSIIRSYFLPGIQMGGHHLPPDFGGD